MTGRNAVIPILSVRDNPDASRAGDYPYTCISNPFKSGWGSEPRFS